MFTQQTLHFLADLKNNNNKFWFDNNKDAYLKAKKEVLDNAAEIAHGIAKFDKEIAQDPEKNIKLFRINRDMRFSKDKSPYKINFGCAIVTGGMKSGKAGYYIHIMPGNNAVAGGVWQPSPEILESSRQGISSHFEEFKKIITSSTFKKTFGSLDNEQKLKKIPTGFDPTDPAGEYLKFKSFTVWKNYSDKELLGKDFVSKALEDFKVMHKLNAFLNKFI
jgi:uncharacterized protein (TIGR02453 family)